MLNNILASFLLGSLPIQGTYSPPAPQQAIEHHTPITIETRLLEPAQPINFTLPETLPTLELKMPSRPSYGPQNSYVAGQCTWYVKNKLPWVPNGWGDARRWAASARSQGFIVTKTPVVGAVAQTSDYALGHVAVVTAVGSGTVTVSEMNWKGPFVANNRTTPVNDWVYIY